MGVGGGGASLTEDAHCQTTALAIVFLEFDASNFGEVADHRSLKSNLLNKNYIQK